MLLHSRSLDHGLWCAENENMQAEYARSGWAALSPTRPAALPAARSRVRRRTQLNHIELRTCWTTLSMQAAAAPPEVLWLGQTLLDGSCIGQFWPIHRGRNARRAWLCATFRTPPLVLNRVPSLSWPVRPGATVRTLLSASETTILGKSLQPRPLLTCSWSFRALKGLTPCRVRARVGRERWWEGGRESRRGGAGEVMMLIRTMWMDRRVYGWMDGSMDGEGG